MRKIIRFRRRVAGGVIFLVTALSAASVFAETASVYFIGNSFTYRSDISGVLNNLSATRGHSVQVGADFIGGSQLEEHWVTGVATNAIANGSYDVVVLQEVSDLAYQPSIEENFNTYAPLYDEVITNSGARTMLYMTWVREVAMASLPNCIAIYRNMAAQLGCEIAPVGEGWRRANEQAPLIDLFSSDRHHQGENGAYLAACCFYGAIFNESPEGIEMRTVGGTILDSADAALLQRIAWDAVQAMSYTNPPVITSMTVDQAVRTNDVPFVFQAVATDNGSIVDYLWNFGDGTSTNGSSLTQVSHTYTADGIFPVTVTVTDNSGETERSGLTATRDTTGPQISSIAATRTLLTVRFNQDIQQASAESVANYAVSDGISVISATLSASDTVRLEVSTLPAGVEYTLTVNNLYSAIGSKILPNTTGTFMYVDGSDMHLRFDFGNTNYPTAGNWNNIPYGGGDLVISNAIDIYGVHRNIGLRRVPASEIGYSSGTGPVASDLYPSTAQRDCLYATREFSYQIEGADPSAEYRLTFFASKSAADRETLFTIGDRSEVLDCAYNTDRVAVIENVKSDVNGNILCTFAPNSVPYCYLSVLEIEDTTLDVSTQIESSVGTLDVTEGTTNSFNLRLGGLPSGAVTVSVNHVSGEAHLQVLSTSSFLYFNTNNWNDWQPVYIEALQDVDSVSGIATIECADIAGVYVITTVTVTQVDTTLIAPTAGFSAAPAFGAEPLVVTFTDTSTGSITNRFWDFGDGGTTNTTATSVAHTYTSGGTNTVQLIASGPVGVSTNIQVNLIHVSEPVPPSAGFTASPTSGTAPLAVTFTDTSTGSITNRFWNFGDGFTINTLATSVAHTYTAAGTNTVQLIVSGSLGASTHTQTLLIRAAPPSGGVVNLNISSAFDYDAVATGAEITYATGQGQAVAQALGDHAVLYKNRTAQPIAFGSDPAGSIPGLPADGLIVGGKYELGAGLTEKYGTATGDTKVNNAVSRLATAALTTRTATITLAAADQKKYSDFNLLVNGTRYGTRSGVTMSANIEVKYVGDDNWYSVWFESVDITSGTPGGTIGGGIDGGGSASAAWNQIEVSDAGYAKWATVTVMGVGSAYMYEMAIPLVLDSTKTLESFQLTSTTTDANRYNEFILYAASATLASAGPEGMDDDIDGLPNDWETQYFGGPTNANASTTAANGVNTIYETYIAGLDPTNSSSMFTVSNDWNILMWNATSGRVYSVYGTTNLLNDFQPLETNILWPQNSWTGQVNGSQGSEFYKLKVELDDSL